MNNPVLDGALAAAALGLALGVLLYLYCCLKMEIRAVDRRRVREAPAEPEVRALRQRLEELETRGRERAPRAEGPSPAAVRPGMNLSRRSQALRLGRQGRTPEQIASSLGMSAGEVRLLLKIHAMVIRAMCKNEGLKPQADSADMPIGAAESHATLAGADRKREHI